MLLRSKLYIPPLRSDHVPRQALVERLQAGLDRRLTVLVAAAGFGKTSCLVELLGRVDRRHALVSLEASDNEPARFWAYVGQALARIRPDLAAATAALRTSPGEIDQLLATWLNELFAHPEPSVLALDDLHTIQEPQIYQQLEHFIEHLPPSLHLVLAGRTPPPLQLALWRGRGELVEVGDRELRFSSAESRTFVTSRGGEITGDQAETLHERTEGWPAGLQLAVLSLAAGERRFESWMREFGGSHRHVAEYLTAEVFEVQPPRLQKALLELSVLDAFDSKLCRRLTGEDDAADLLAELVASSLPIVPLDTEGRWFRFHHLFGEYLKNRFVATDPVAAESAHRRASGWYEEHDDVERAFEQSLAAGDRERATRLLTHAAPELINRSELLTLIRAFRRLETAFRDLDADLLIHVAWAMFLTGREAELAAALEALESYRRAGELESGIIAQLSNIQAGIARQRGDLEGAIQAAEMGLAELPEEASPLRAGLALYLAVARFFLGDVAGAVEASETGLRCFSHDEPLPLVGVSCLSVLSQSRACQGRLAEAEALCRRALADQESGDPSLALIHRSLGRIHLERGHWDAARDAFATARELCGSAGFSELAALILLWSAETAWVVGDLAGCRQAMREMDTLAVRDKMTAGLEQWQRALRLHLALDVSDQAAADREADESRRVLGPIPSLLDEKLRIARLRWAGRQNLNDEARQMLGEMLALANRQGRRESEIELLVWKAWLEESDGNLEEAREQMARALDLARHEEHLRPFAMVAELTSRLLAGMPGDPSAWRERVRREMGELIRRRQELSGGGTSAGLTERQLDVLRLAAEGCSNQQIAARLFVSLSTVKTHLQHIFDKLEVRRRTQAVARSRELGLL